MDSNDEYSKIPYDHPAASAKTEQMRSTALTAIRESRTFAIFAIPPDGDGSVHTVSVISASDEHDNDTGCIEGALCEMLVRSYFDDAPDNDDGSEITTLDIVAVLLARRQLIANVHDTINRILREKGWR